MRITLLSPRNDLTGHRKLLTMFARELGRRHAVRILYPVIPDRAFNAHHYHPLRGIRYAAKCVRDMTDYLAHPHWRYASLMGDGAVRVTAYWQAIPMKWLEQADVIVYSSAYQALELDAIPHGRAIRVFYVMHEQSRTDAHVIEPTLTQQTYHRADHVIALSEETRQHVSELGVTPEAIIPAGVDTTRFYPDGIVSSQPPTLLGYYWPAEPRKGAQQLLAALDRVRQRHPGLSIQLLTHKGSRAQGYPSFHELSEQRLAELYRRAAIFVYPSIAGGGFALPPLEAMASGCGVVAAPVGTIGEYLRHDISGVLCDTRSVEQLATQIERLIQQPDLLARIRQQAVIDAQAWSWRHAAERLECYLGSIMKHHECLVTS